LVASSSASIRGPSTANVEVASPSVRTRRRRRLGSTCSSFASARSEVSPIPAIKPAAAVRRPTATATASASSSSNGGSSAPEPSR
jgi:hypothetical protein